MVCFVNQRSLNKPIAYLTSIVSEGYEVSVETGQGKIASRILSLFQADKVIGAVWSFQDSPGNVKRSSGFARTGRVCPSGINITAKVGLACKGEVSRKHPAYQRSNEGDPSGRYY
jgi:hypothetical protein